MIPFDIFLVHSLQYFFCCQLIINGLVVISPQLQNSGLEASVYQKFVEALAVSLGFDANAWVIVRVTDFADYLSFVCMRRSKLQSFRIFDDRYSERGGLGMRIQ